VLDIRQRYEDKRQLISVHYLVNLHIMELSSPTVKRSLKKKTPRRFNDHLLEALRQLIRQTLRGVRVITTLPK
jgi:hypothetical protein